MSYVVMWYDIVQDVVIKYVVHVCFAFAELGVPQLKPHCTPQQLKTILDKYTGIRTLDLAQYRSYSQGGGGAVRIRKGTRRLVLAVCTGHASIQSLRLPHCEKFQDVSSMTQLTSLHIGLFSTCQVIAISQSLTKLQHLRMTSWTVWPYSDSSNACPDMQSLTRLSCLHHLQVDCHIPPPVLQGLTGLTSLRFFGCESGLFLAAPGVCEAVQQMSKLQVLDLGYSILATDQVRSVNMMSLRASLENAIGNFGDLSPLWDLSNLQCIRCRGQMYGKSYIVTIADRLAVGSSAGATQFAKHGVALVFGTQTAVEGYSSDECDRDYDI